VYYIVLHQSTRGRILVISPSREFLSSVHLDGLFFLSSVHLENSCHRWTDDKITMFCLDLDGLMTRMLARVLVATCVSLSQNIAILQAGPSTYAGCLSPNLFESGFLCSTKFVQPSQWPTDGNRKGYRV
jgi:hypothetical protein